MTFGAAAYLCHTRFDKVKSRNHLSIQAAYPNQTLLAFLLLPKVVLHFLCRIIATVNATACAANAKNRSEVPPAFRRPGRFCYLTGVRSSSDAARATVLLEVAISVSAIVIESAGCVN